jgi:hypothetical protein
VYNVELVRALCHDISVEKDALKAQELVSLLQAVLKDDHEGTARATRSLSHQY